MSMEALFAPRGVVVVGASTHPGKFGFVTLHNLIDSGYEGAIFATNHQRSEVLGIQTVSEVTEYAGETIDLAVICTPKAAVEQVVRDCHQIGVTAVFVTSAGYAEAGETGAVDQQRLVELCQELGVTLAGPNGQGVVSTPAKLCAQIVAPYPPSGSIGIASQSGNFVSSFMNWSQATGVGVSRAVSAGNAAACTVTDYLEWFGTDAATKVGLAYVEGLARPREFFERLSSVTGQMPVVVVKGGTTSDGAAAAASHTGSLASNASIFAGACRQFGLTQAATIEDAFTAAATFATQPLPVGGRTVILTTAGGWGVVTADAVGSEPDLEVMALPPDLQSQLDSLLPPRWSHNNPVDCAGGETRDTIPEVLGLIAQHRDVDAVIYLGIGIQSNQAKMFAQGRFAALEDVQRITAYHRRQDERFATAAAELIAATGKPILVATELAIADPSNPGPATLRSHGLLCYSSGNQAVRALGHLVRYAKFRGLTRVPSEAE